MIKTIKTRYKKGRVLMDKDINIPDDSVIYISYVNNEENNFYLSASQTALDKIWDNEEDDIYENLLNK